MQNSTDPWRLDGRRALITGASRGIGLAAAAALAERGAEVWMLARGTEALEAAAERQRQRGHIVHTLVADVADAECRAELVAAVSEQAGTLDILVNNVGFNIRKPALSLSDRAFLLADN